MGGNRKTRSARVKGRGEKPRSQKNRSRKTSRPGHEVLYGFHSVYEALRAGRRQFESILLSDRRAAPRVEKVGELAQSKGIIIQDAAPETLERLSQGGNHQGIAARVSAFPVKPSEDIWAELRNRETPFFILMAESIEDPHNLGALIRTALCADVDYIVVPKDRSALPTPAVSRTSAGAMEHADIFMATNLAALMRDLKKEGAWISGLDAGGDKALFEADLTGNLVLVVGGEHKGIRPGVRKECDFILSIPISGKVNSLNASVAGGVAMYEARRQRGDAV
ncbi:MAG: 23S rRNA (guanosine(2251)-2'-O)-methyltransferase RlmB [Desulfobacterales bacterium]|nr:23S rRNA (guanosine(2251)-2'-O)-methyltransferase RlmB [Desulfobacterales bacterium]